MPRPAASWPMAHRSATTIGKAADYVAKILHGAAPAELPVGQPTEFDFVINLKTAEALGLALPQALRARAEKI